MTTIGIRALEVPNTYIQVYIQVAFDGSTTSFSLYDAVSGGNLVSIGSAENLEVILAGVRQQPQVDYTVSGSQITFIVAPIFSTSFFAIRQAQVQDIPVPGTGTIGTNQLVDGAVTESKIVANGITPAKLSVSLNEERGTTYIGTSKVTNVGVSWVSGREYLYSYKDPAGTWRLRFNIYGTTSSVSSINPLIIDGVTMASTQQAISVFTGGTNWSVGTTVASGIATYNSVAVTSWEISGDVELASKPTWA